MNEENKSTCAQCEHYVEYSSTSIYCSARGVNLYSTKPCDKFIKKSEEGTRNEEMV